MWRAGSTDPGPTIHRWQKDLLPLPAVSSFSERLGQVSQDDYERIADIQDRLLALTLLDDPLPTAPYHGDLLPRDASLERRQLAASVVQGCVFGGMGSWNDSGPSDPAPEREFEQVGANLYAALLTALPAAANGA